MYKKKASVILVFYSLASFAQPLIPIPGLYGGVNIAPSWASSTDVLNGSYTVDKLTYTMMGGIGGQLGYRWQNLRLEGELFYNASPYNSITYNSPDAGGYTKLYANNDQTNYISGETNILTTMLNIYYDFLNWGIGPMQITPYVGAGGGYAWVQNDLNVFLDGTQTYTNQYYPNNSGLAGQLIAGLLFFIDESSYFGLDYRYFTTVNEHQQLGQVTSSFQNQLMSINLSFNGSFNWG
jgi:hypothetical protein